MKSSDNKNIYKALAPIYDDLMRDINYEDWADFIDEVIQTHHPEAKTILELGCGTGSFSISLDELDFYDISATDFSDEMLDIAKTKAVFKKSNVKWKNLDFHKLSEGETDQTFNVLLMLFDTINYIQNPEDVVSVLQNLKKLMDDNAVLIFDFTTPTNSLAAEESLNEEGVSNQFYYRRKSYYLETERYHYNEFEIDEIDDDGEIVDQYQEVHRQKIYKLSEMKKMITDAGFTIEGAYEGFDLIDANENSDRITMVLR